MYEIIYSENLFLIKDLKQRFGINVVFDENKKQPFIRNMHSHSFEPKKIEEPFKIILEDSLDVTNFGDEFTQEEPVSSEITEKNLDLIKSNKDQFDEFNEEHDNYDN